MITSFVIEWFDQANRGAALHWMRSFYPLKEWVLERYGRHDGWDLQKIEHKCWYCNARPNCGNCDGTGIYRTHKTWLKRHKLGDRLFHTLASPGYVPEAVEQITGKIQHEPVDYAIARRAIFLCFLWFRPLELLRLWVHQKLDAKDLIYWNDETWWEMAKSVVCRLKERFFPSASSEEIPF